MDDLVAKAGAGLLALGLPGIVILALAAALYLLFRLYCDVQEKRISEALANVKSLGEFKASLDALKAAFDVMTRTGVSPH